MNISGIESALNQVRGGGTPRQSGSGERDPLREVAQEFEALFIQQMFDAMRETIDREESLMHGGFAEEVFEDMLYEQYSLTMARQGGTGLADLVYDQFAQGASGTQELSGSEAGDRAAPSGDRAAPAGDRAAPAGDRAAPSRSTAAEVRNVMNSRARSRAYEASQTPLP